MELFTIHSKTRDLLADTITPVSVYVKLRDIYPNTLLLESSDYHGSQNSFSFICIQPFAEFSVEKDSIKTKYPDGTKESIPVTDLHTVTNELSNFIKSFKFAEEEKNNEINGLYGYTSYDAIRYFESIKLTKAIEEPNNIPELRYCFYKYIIAINHYKNSLSIIENTIGNEESEIDKLESLLNNRNIAFYPFKTKSGENSNLSDDEYKAIVKKGKEHCYRGDVFQVVLSRRFSQGYTGDDFNVYRSLRSINPSPYLFYFDYGNYRIFGSSPESQLEIKNGKASINPIAGTFRRTGDDEKDKELAKQLVADEKENAEHVMLVDLARNDLSRNATNVKMEYFREVHYYSHVLHLVSKVSGNLPKDVNSIKVMADSFPAGTLTGAPKYKAMQIIDQCEPTRRGYYGGCIGSIGLNGNFNHAIMIRSFLSKNNTLYYQAGAGIVAASTEEGELNEVNGKLAALKNAILLAEEI